MILFQNYIDTYSERSIKQFNADRQEYLDQLMQQTQLVNENAIWIKILRQYFLPQALSIGEIIMMVENTRL